MKFIKRFPHFIQNNSSDCGPTSLRMIARHYGLDYSTEMLRKHCHITRGGVNLLGISDAAEYIGFDTIGVKVSFEQLAKKGVFPCILHWNQNHFVVCYGIEKNKKGEYKIHISDPASQRLTYTKDEFERCWIGPQASEKSNGVALMLEPGDNFGKIEDEYKKNSRSLLSFAKYFTPYRNMIGQLVLAMLVGSLLQIILPFLSQAMVDQGINGRNLNIISLILFAQLGFFVATLSIDYIRSWIMLHMNSRIDIQLIADFLIKLTAMPLRFFDSRMTGDILQRIGDHGRIKNFLLSNSMRIVFSLINFVVFLAILAYYNVLVLTIFLIGNILYVIWISFFMRYRRELDIKRFNQSAMEQSKMIQLVQGMQDIKLNNCERQKRWEWERIQVRLFKIGLKGLRIGQIQQSGSVFFTQTTHILIYYIAAKSVVEGSMTLGMMMSLTYIIGQVSAPIGEFIGFAQSFQDAKISLERLNEIHSQDDEETNIDKKLSTLPKEQDIEIKDLSFSYTDSERDLALKNISLSIPAHKVTAIVGESGCGKTTLIKLLQGFYEPTHGSIKVGGTRLSDINPHTWRAATGSVMQDSFIFSDTIANNIAVNSDETDKEKMKNAAHMARIDDFVESLPLGYDTIIGMEGKGVSQGQRQRILIARAIYKNPRYIFLDEATNSLDATNEAKIMENLRQFYEGRTVVISAHRLSTIHDADQIVVMNNGEIVERGNHKSLLKKKGKYYELVKHQINVLDE
ncbi:peptidase domain-containing ABC transporter [Prevotella sp. E15-22]|uniref:peptidase domain-containing ABC transporter n=1 Tax=Prevotella sp. E15-22 TaxID=2937774 RepID=UPI0020704495|nr:peptidase domain-containing ABC transporter [Prevotella sp. E15-22]UPS44578.1 peptidase domain-containing ABC transporter [Prevotella sp. E15-22]